MYLYRFWEDHLLIHFLSSSKKHSLNSHYGPGIVLETRNESHSLLLKWIKVYRWESILAILLISEQGSHKNISEGCSAWAGLSGTGERDIWLLHLESELSRNDSDLEKSHKQQGQWTVTALIRYCCTGRGSLTRVTEAMRKH